MGVAGVDGLTSDGDGEGVLGEGGYCSCSTELGDREESVCEVGEDIDLTCLFGEDLVLKIALVGGSEATSVG